MSETTTNHRLIARAASLLNPRRLKDFFIGDVAAVLVSGSGKLYSGVCIGGYLGICAEQSAIAAMITAGETRIHRIVAVWKDANGTTFVLPPCGRCREFMRQINADNRDTEVLVGADKIATLAELIPYYDPFAHPLTS